MERPHTSSVATLALTFALAAGCAPHEAAPESAMLAGLSDAEIAHIAVTANRLDVELAELAETRASDPEVLRFAETMIADHTAVNERAAELAGRLGVTPRDNPVSQSLSRDAAETAARLSALRGEAFDRAYLEHEVAYHQAVLEALDTTLVPQTENAELRALLREVRPVIAAHGAHARAIRTRLGGASTAAGAAPAPRTHVVEIRGFEYGPQTLEIAPGDTVVCVNRGAVPHTATAAGGAWDSGAIAPDARWQRVYTEPGRTPYTCTFHPGMRGTVVVE